MVRAVSLPRRSQSSLCLRRRGGLALVIACAGGLGACSSSTGRVTALSSTETTRPGSDSQCSVHQLRLIASTYGEAGAMYTQTFVFTNTSAASCWLEGWPRFQPERGSGQPEAVSTWTVRQTAPPTPASETVTLDSRATASFDVYNADWDSLANQACPTTSAALITPPGSSSALKVGIHVPDCPYPFKIAPVIAGSSDRQAWSLRVS